MSLYLLLLGFISIPMAMTADTEVVVLRAVRGRTARLPCGQGKVFLDGPSAYILWLKNDKEFLYRYPNEDEKKSSKPWIQDLGCATESGGCSDDTSLLIKYIEESDEGLYRCRVHYQASPSQDYVIEVVLVGSTGVPKIYNEVAEEITKSYVGPYSLGADFTLICEVKDGFNEDESETIVYWRRNGEIVEKSTTKQKEEHSLRSEVTVRNITRNELNAHYECIAQNADVTEPLIRSVVIKMYLPPLSVEIRLNNNVNFEAGSPRLVDCVVVGCVPPPAVTWHLDQQLIRPTSHKEVHEGNYTVSSLSLSPTIGHFSRTLRCRAHNPHLPRHLYQDSIVINVGYKPVCSSGVSLVPKSTDRMIHEDMERTSETVICQVESMPEPIQFTWNLPDSRTLVTAVKQVEGRPHLYTSTLTWIPRPDDLGTLSCSASNVFGEQKRSCDYTLSPYGVPQVPNCVLRRIEEDDIKVLCETGWNSGRSQLISLEVLNENGSIVYNTSNPLGQFHLTALPEFRNNLSMRVVASNYKGSSPPLYLHMSSFASPSTIPDPSFSQMWLWGPMASIFGVVIIIILLFYTLKSKRKPLGLNPDLVPTPDGSFHREPELEREERVLGTTNITVNQLAPCQNQYASTPVFCRVRVGCNQTPTCDQNICTAKQSYYV